MPRVLRVSWPHLLQSLNKTLRFGSVRSHGSARELRSRATVEVANAILREGCPPGPWVVTLTRHGPRKLDDDNLSAAFKRIRDGVADALGVDDGNRRRVRWEYKQRRGAYEVGISIATRKP